MRRVVWPILVLGVGLVLLADLLVANPSLSVLGRAASELLVLLAAGAAVAAALSLAAHHAMRLWHRRDGVVASLAVLAGMAAMLVAGLRPDGGGAGDPAVAWMLGALVVPLVASLFGLLFVYTLLAARRALALRSREATLMLAVAAVVLVLLLPLAGPMGDSLAAAAGWTLAVPIAGVFRGLLIGIALVAALVAARTLLAIGGGDD